MKSPSNISDVRLTQQGLGSCGLAKADAQTTLPTDKVPAIIKNIQRLREAYHSLKG